VVGARLIRDGATTVVPLPEGSVLIRPNRSGFHVLFRAPFFDDYTSAFLDPQLPDAVDAGSLRLLFAVDQPGSFYLPQAFAVDLPRALDHAAPDSVFDPADVRLLRAPSSPVQPGWAIVRLRATESGTNPPAPLPGVLVRIYRSPRQPGALPLGTGMTEWRGHSRGEAMVALTGVERFRPGEGDAAVVSALPVAIELAREEAFTGGEGQLPDIAGIETAAPGIGPAAPGFRVRHVPGPTNIRAGRDHYLELEMP
jgi:hypothetical protein